jgi:hypothetical protein
MHVAGFARIRLSATACFAATEQSADIRPCDSPSEHAATDNANPNEAELLKAAAAVVQSAASSIAKEAMYGSDVRSV